MKRLVLKTITVTVIIGVMATASAAAHGGHSRKQNYSGGTVNSYSTSQHHGGCHGANCTDSNGDGVCDYYGTDSRMHQHR